MYYGIYDNQRQEFRGVGVNKDMMIIEFAEHWFDVAEDDLLNDYEYVKEYMTELDIETFDDYMNHYFGKFWSPKNREEKIQGAYDFLNGYDFTLEEINKELYDELAKDEDFIMEFYE